MTDDPFRGDGGRPDSQDPAASGSTEHFNAPTVRARIQPKRSDAGFPAQGAAPGGFPPPGQAPGLPPSWPVTEIDVSGGAPVPPWGDTPAPARDQQPPHGPQPPDQHPQYPQPQYHQQPRYPQAPQHPADGVTAQLPPAGGATAHLPPANGLPLTAGSPGYPGQRPPAAPQPSRYGTSPAGYSPQPLAYGPQQPGYGQQPGFGPPPPPGQQPPYGQHPGQGQPPYGQHPGQGQPPYGQGQPPPYGQRPVAGFGPGAGGPGVPGLSGAGMPGAGTRSGTGKVVAVSAGLVLLLGLFVGGGYYLLRPRGTAATGTPSMPSVTTLGEPSGTPFGASENPADEPEATPTEPDVPSLTPRAPTRPRATSISALKAGDCVQKLSGSKITSVPVIDCSAPHEVQLVGQYTPRKGTYPGHKQLVKTGAAGCAPVVKSAVRAGAPTVETVPLVPSEATWKSGNRRILCFVGAPDAGDLNESVVDGATV